MLVITSKLPASRRSPTARLIDQARQVEKLAANEAATKATGGAEHRKELATKLQITAGKSSSKLNTIRGILRDNEALHKECQKDLVPEKGK